MHEIKQKSEADDPPESSAPCLTGTCLDANQYCESRIPTAQRPAKGGHDQEYQEHKKQNLGDTSCGSRESGET